MTFIGEAQPWSRPVVLWGPEIQTDSWQLSTKKELSYVIGIVNVAFLHVRCPPSLTRLSVGELRIKITDDVVCRHRFEIILIVPGQVCLAVHVAHPCLAMTRQ